MYFFFVKTSRQDVYPTNFTHIVTVTKEAHLAKKYIKRNEIKNN